MINLTIGITGASGFIGSALTNYLTDKGFSVIPFVRNIFAVDSTAARRYDLTENISEELFRGVDILIHCAFVTKEQHADAEHVNYEGTKQLIVSCRKQGVKKIIFFSSVTANENARSAYAKSKFAIHQLLNTDADLIIRCSLVIGKGGLFYRLLNYARTHTFIPVIGSGQMIIQFVAIDDVETFIGDAIARDLSGNWVLASNEQVTYKQLFTAISDVYRIKIHFIPIPAFLVKIGLKACNFLGIRTPVTGENISGLQTLRVNDQLAFLSSTRPLKHKLEELRDSLPEFQGKKSR